MYLEVHIESNPPQVFLLDQNEIMVGCLPENEIYIDLESVSKRHVKLVCDKKKWFATDQGSTNGTFIENERLIPGQRKEIFVNQYLRLGDSVFIALVKNAQNTNEAPKPIVKQGLPTRVPEEKTKVINLKELSEAKTTPKKVQHAVEKKSAFDETDSMMNKAKPREQKRERSISTKTLVIVFIILFGGYVLNEKFREDLDINKSNLHTKATEMVKKSSNQADKISE